MVKIKYNPLFDENDPGFVPGDSVLNWPAITRGVTAVSVWMSLNISLQFLNKHLFTEGFRFPVLIIMCGTIMTFLGSAILVLCCRLAPFSWDEVTANWKGFMGLAIAHSLTTVLENMSIMYISISLNQIIKTTVPAFTMLFAWCYYGKTFGLGKICTTLGVIIGASITVLKNPEYQWFGFACAVGSAVCAALHTLITGSMLKQRQATMTITLVTSLPSVVLLLPLFWTMESDALTHHVDKHTSQTAILLVIVSCLGFMYSLSQYALIAYTSAQYSVVISNVKVVVIVLLSIVVFGTEFRSWNFLGMVIAMMSFVGYNYFKYDDMREKKTSETYVKMVVKSNDAFGEITEEKDDSDGQQQRRTDASGSGSSRDDKSPTTSRTVGSPAPTNTFARTTPVFAIGDEDNAGDGK